MRIGIAGAGAVGCHYGSLFQRAGYDVRFLTRGAHLEAMRDTGLRHVSGGKQHTQRVYAGDHPSILEECGIVILTCKMTDLDIMLKCAAPYLGGESLLVTLQNGVEAPDMLSAAFPTHAIVAGTAFIGARIEKPGTVIHSAAGGVRLGLWQHGKGEGPLRLLIQSFAKAGVPIREETDARLMLWRKLLWNCGFNAITAITHRFARDMAADRETLAIVREAMEETVAIARAEHIGMSEEDINKHIRITLEMGPVKTSMWQDMERGKCTEVNYINGFVARKANAMGLDAPANRMLTTLVHALEQAC
ncbi:MAG: 2-dehydropantoate 2-reductase [Mariprofundaceae bacterium]|nr:2-dehydropantoate 2-reductase [Mariprofundaceae bacterium]